MLDVDARLCPQHKMKSEHGKDNMPTHTHGCWEESSTFSPLSKQHLSKVVFKNDFHSGLTAPRLSSDIALVPCSTWMRQSSHGILTCAWCCSPCSSRLWEVWVQICSSSLLQDTSALKFIKKIRARSHLLCQAWPLAAWASPQCKACIACDAADESCCLFTSFHQLELICCSHTIFKSSCLNQRWWFRSACFVFFPRYIQ